jgi:AcrR family transcriptional regulator
VKKASAKTAAPKQKRQRRYGDVTKEDFVDAALKILKRGGASELSMRALSEELHLSPMAAYYHVPNKESLVLLVMDRINRSIYEGGVADTSGTPEERLNRSLWRAFEAYRQYPGLLLLTSIHTVGDEQKRVQRHSSALMHEVGVAPDLIPAAMVSTWLLLFGAIRAAESASPAEEKSLRQWLETGAKMIVRGALEMSAGASSRTRRGA